MKKNINNKDMDLNFKGFDEPFISPDYTDQKGEKYMSVVYEYALTHNKQYVIEKTGIAYSELDKIINTENFKREVSKVEKEIEANGGSSVKLKSDLFSHNAVEVLNGIMLNENLKASDRIEAAKLVFELSGLIKKKDEGPQAQQVVIQFKTKEDKKENLD